MASRLAKFIVLLAAVHLLGGHWVTLQTLAWAKMVVTFAQAEGFGSAVAKTFDGEHPCDLCHVVKAGREAEQKEQVVKVVLKVDAVLASAAEIPQPFVQSYVFRSYDPAGSQRPSLPPTPPPLA